MKSTIVKGLYRFEYLHIISFNYILIKNQLEKIVQYYIIL